MNSRWFGWKVRTALAGVVLAPLVHLVALDRLARRLAALPSRRGPAPDDDTLSEWVDRLLTRLPWPWRRTCLKRAVVLYHLLHRAGRPAVLHIGVRRDGAAKLEAHAWLTRNDMIVLEPPATGVEDFLPIASFPDSVSATP